MYKYYFIQKNNKMCSRSIVVKMCHVQCLQIILLSLLSLTEPPINTLNELSEAMRDSGLQLLVEVQSASQAMLEVRICIILYYNIKAL